MAQEDIQTSNSTDEMVDTKLVEPLNITDPVVYHDGKVDHRTVAELYDPVFNYPIGEDGITSTYTSGDRLKLEGIIAPIIQVNNLKIDMENINSFTLNYTDFLPEVYLEISDYNRYIQFADSPGLNSSLTVILVPSVENIYRTIALDFEITKFEVNDTIISYYGKLKINKLQQQRDYGMIKYMQKDGKKGCSNVVNKPKENTSSTSSNDQQVTEDIVECNHNPSNTPNTWEYLHEIALDCGLGFATTKKCQDVEDRMPRLLRGQSYQDFILEQISYSGATEEDMFDVWIDLYGYLTLVNVYWVLNNDTVQLKNLSITCVTGIQSDLDEFGTLEPVTVPRLLTNFAQFPKPHNNIIKPDGYCWLSENYVQQYSGTLEHRIVFVPKGVGNGNNNLIHEDVEEMENSVDGKHTEDYEKRTISFYTEFNPYNTNMQENRRKHFFNKRRAKRLQVELSVPNLGLQRGTLVGISIWTDEIHAKQHAMQGNDKINDENVDNVQPENPDIGFDNQMILLNEGLQYPSDAYSDLYYIDGMSFTYQRGMNNIQQTLFLIKKGPLSSHVNKYGPIIFNENAMGNGTPESSDVEEIDSQNT